MYFRRHPLRVGAVFCVIITLFTIFSIKLGLIQIFRASYLAEKASKQNTRLIELEPKRGTIYDRNMHALALNVPAYSLFVNTRALTKEQKSKIIITLSKVLGVDQKSLEKKMGRRSYFTWLYRKISQEAYEKLKAAKLTGLGFVKESKRFYPNGQLGAHLIGFANIDNQGLQGVELEFDKQLHGVKGMAEVLRDAKQRDLLLERNYVAPKDGLDVVLTIDETIQFITEKALAKAFERHKAKMASVIVVNPKTGEVLAFASLPTFRPDAPERSPLENRTNRTVAFVYEPGSVFKIVTAAAALEEGITNEEEIIFCENGKYRIANHTLKDDHPNGDLTFREVVEKSSNIGTVKIAQRLGADKVYEYAKRFRFGVKTNIGMVGEVPGLLKPVSRWSKLSIGAIPIGHEVTVTAVQLVMSMAVIANDGVMMKPYIIKAIRDPQGGVIEMFHPQELGRVISEKTAYRMREILRGVIETGTAKQAKIKGISAGGKTGTAQKVVNGRYSNSHHVASFIGFAPVEDPQFAIVISVDEPRNGYYGGTVAGSVFREIVEESMQYLQRSKE